MAILYVCIAMGFGVGLAHFIDSIDELDKDEKSYYFAKVVF